MLSRTPKGVISLSYFHAKTRNRNCQIGHRNNNPFLNCHWKVDPEERLKYQREEEVAQNKAKKPKVEHENTQRMFIG